MLNKRQRRIFAIIALLVILLMVLGIAAPVLRSSADDLNSLQSQYNQYEKQYQANQKTIESYNSKTSDLNGQKAALEKSISLLGSQIGVLNAKISALNAGIRQKQTELDAKQADIETNYALYKKRLRAMYEIGDMSYVRVLFSSTDFSDFLQRVNALRVITDHDNKLLAQLKADRQAIAADKSAIEASKNDLQSSQTALSQKQGQQAAQSAQDKNLIAQYQNAASDLADANSDIQKKMKQTENQIASLKSLGSFVGGGFLCPIQGMSNLYISSGYGPRTNPYTGQTGTFHEGVDIAGSGIYGHPVLAANSGQIRNVQTNNAAYGNCITVDHGGGIMSFYGHMSRIAPGISTGVNVAKGQVIGYVGSTGWSTGPHLHLGIIVNNQYVDPHKYVPLPG